MNRIALKPSFLLPGVVVSALTAALLASTSFAADTIINVQAEECGLMVATLGKPFTQPVAKLHVGIFGAGDVVRRYQGPAYKALVEKYGKDRVQVTFIDNSQFWKGNSISEAKMKANIEGFATWNAKYFDKADYANDPAHLAEAIRAQNFDAFLIETPDMAHVSDMEFILDTYGDNPPQVFFDKPFGADRDEVFNFLGRLVARENQFHGFDHFKAMLISDQFQANVEKFGGGLDPENFIFRLEENHTYSDKNYPAIVDSADDAIRREAREKALQKGLVLDLMSHGFGAQTIFGSISSTIFKYIKAAQYEGAPIAGETWAEVGFDFTGKKGGIIHARSIIGKGIKGVKGLGSEFDDETFSVELVWKNGNRMVANMGARYGKAYFYTADGKLADTVQINNLPYNVAAESILQGNYLKRGMFLTPQEAFDSMDVLSEIRGVIQRHMDKKDLPTFPGAKRGQNGEPDRDAPYEEDVSARVQPIWGSVPATHMTKPVTPTANGDQK